MTLEDTISIIVISCCFRAPQPDMNIFIYELDSRFKNICNRKNVFPLGDFNIYLL